ncbi:class I SAM-dependent methyltransferase [Georgenia alba]|uniref:Class I SAM-dependent methyltransferase n=1 Tax=Georgenia alba TaxID=2233858 RepID=A0ABW2QAZ6_9MICO
MAQDFEPMQPVKVDHAEAIAANRANWDDRAVVHVASRDYGVEDYLTDPDHVSGVAAEDLRLLAPHLPNGTDLTGLDVVHLQCHIGTDTLSLARHGARMTGVDLSPGSLAAARELAARTGTEIRYVEAEVTAAAAVVGETFDVVYTSIGVLPWIPDLAAWGRTVAALLRPGGVFYLRDQHPFLTTMDDTRGTGEDGDGELVVAYRYFGDSWAQTYDEALTYTDGDHSRIESTRNYEWPHPVSEVVGALLDAGLRLTGLEEHRTLPWPALPQMRPADGGGWELPPGQRDRLPVAFSVVARKD